MRLISIIITCAVFLVPAKRGFADDDWAARDYEYASRTLDNFYDRHYWDLVAPNSSASRYRNKPARPISTAIVLRKQPRMPDVLAASEPTAVRAKRAAFYREMLAAYAVFAQQAGVPNSDVAAAVAAFIAGSYMMYRQVDVDTTTYKRIVQQLRERMAAAPSFTKVPLAEKQDMFERAAIVGMTMASGWLRKEDQREAAKGWLEWMFKVDADRIEITTQGLTIRDR